MLHDKLHFFYILPACYPQCLLTSTASLNMMTLLLSMIYIHFIFRTDLVLLKILYLCIYIHPCIGNIAIGSLQSNNRIFLSREPIAESNIEVVFLILQFPAYSDKSKMSNKEVF
jgi:hypothetical protein